MIDQPLSSAPILDTSSGVPKRRVLQWVLIGIVIVLVAVAAIVLPRIFAELAYPLAYEDVIRDEALAHDLDPFLVAAVVYAESRYRPTATSPVGARGLMQLMPLTGGGIAKRLGDTQFTLDDLYDPATNIRYGTYHLQGLMGRYQSNVEAALVGYNGGGGAGDRFARGELGSVPNESLRYYKKVLLAKSMYEELYPVRLGSDTSLAEFFETEPRETVATKLLKVIRSTVVERIGQ
ncbi:lytic transglycosylase domain-containing protein [Candidatus Berkelbacteria bacterium]|nr:lytic transglycosylase domain-containing protein [Candidatus Berkelbacteria bacterium]